MYQIEDGKIKWNADYWDTGDLKRQLSDEEKEEKEPEHKPRFSIEKDKINDLRIGAFRGKISVITPYSSHDKVNHAIKVLGSSRVLGFDTETKPAYRKGESYPIALLQLSTDSLSIGLASRGAVDLDVNVNDIEAGELDQFALDGLLAGPAVPHVNSPASRRRSRRPCHRQRGTSAR